MDRIWQWAWDRYGARYSWAICAVVFVGMLPIYLLLAFLVVAMQKSTHFVEAAVVTGVAVVLNTYVVVLPGSRLFHPAQQWAAGREIDRGKALQATYTWTRAVGVRALWFLPVWTAALLAVVAAVSGASASRLVQYAILGAATGIAMALIGVHTSVQGALRPARAALAGETGLGDTLPRSRPTFGAWLILSLLGSFFTFAVGGAMLAVVLDRASEIPVLFAAIGCLWTALGVPITVGAIVSPS